MSQRRFVLRCRDIQHRRSRRR